MPCIDIQSPQRTQYKSHNDYNHRKNVHPEKPVIFKRKEIFKFYHVIQYIFGAKIQYENEKAANASQHLRLPFFFFQRIMLLRHCIRQK